MEASNAKNTARLLHMSLPYSKLEIGESFAPEHLQALLHAPSSLPQADGDAAQPVQPVLLYTDDASLPATSRFDARAMLVDGKHKLERLRLVIVDGTWRKSRKMLFQNPLLQSLPRLALRDTPTSQYMIRKAHRSDQLSTLEASCYALMQLEKNSEKYHPLLTALDNFVVQQGLLRFRGQSGRRGE
jgi:DTW domain-containing protein YfiP